MRHIHHTLHVRYPSPVRDSVRQLRVFPPERRGGQRLLSLDWHCEPSPDEAQETRDEFGNRVLTLRHGRIAREWCFEMQAQVVHDESPQSVPDIVPATGRGAFLLFSARCDAGAKLQAAARIIKGEDSTFAARACEWTHRTLGYDIQAAGQEASASQVIERGRGACGDLAHVLIALCRSRGLPARYVSGYSRAQGLMHAWVEVLCGDIWRALDPTYGGEAGDDAVSVAIGRDRRDVVPCEGSYRGRAGAVLESKCWMET